MPAWANMHALPTGDRRSSRSKLAGWQGRSARTMMSRSRGSTSATSRRTSKSSAGAAAHGQGYTERACLSKAGYSQLRHAEAPGPLVHGSLLLHAVFLDQHPLQHRCTLERTCEQVRQQATPHEEGRRHGDGDRHRQLRQARQHLGGPPLGAVGQAVGDQRVRGGVECQEQLQGGYAVGQPGGGTSPATARHPV